MISEKATACPHCGEPLKNEMAVQEAASQQMQQTVQQSYSDKQSGMMPKPDSHLVSAILITLCCCFVPGIVSIAYAISCNSAYSAGDYAGAVRSSKLAKTWRNWGLILGGIYYVLLLIYVVFIWGIALI